MDRQYDGKYVGKIITYPSECYDKRTDRIVIKNRPGLAISQTQSGTYIVLPLSTKEPRNTEEMKFDLKVDPEDYPELHLRKTSWIKPGMQTCVYEPTVTHEISDMARTNPELYRKALMTHLEWNHQVNMNAVNHALKIRVEQTNASADGRHRKRCHAKRSRTSPGHPPAGIRQNGREKGTRPCSRQADRDERGAERAGKTALPKGLPEIPRPRARMPEPVALRGTCRLCIPHWSKAAVYIQHKAR